MLLLLFWVAVSSRSAEAVMCRCFAAVATVATLTVYTAALTLFLTGLAARTTQAKRELVACTKAAGSLGGALKIRSRDEGVVCVGRGDRRPCHELVCACHCVGHRRTCCWTSTHPARSL